MKRRGQAASTSGQATQDKSERRYSPRIAPAAALSE